MLAWTIYISFLGAAALMLIPLVSPATSLLPPPRRPASRDSATSVRTLCNRRLEEPMAKTLLCVICIFSTVGLPGWSQDSSKEIYKDSNAAIPDRARDRLSRMTVEEKVAQLVPSLDAFRTFAASFRFLQGFP